MPRWAWIALGVAALLLLTSRAVFAVKPGATLSTRPEMEYARRIVAALYRRRGLTVTVTEGWATEGHTASSKHYEGLAEDYRTRDLPGGNMGPTARALADEIRGALGSFYDVALEADHIHVEYDPA